MQTLLTAALALNFALEAFAATVLIGGPGGFADAAAPAASRWSMHYGFAVIAIASAGVWLWPVRRELAALTPVLGILTMFHGGVLISLLRAGDQAQGAVFQDDKVEER